MTAVAVRALVVAGRRRGAQVGAVAVVGPDRGRRAIEAGDAQRRKTARIRLSPCDVRGAIDACERPLVGLVVATRHRRDGLMIDRAGRLDPALAILGESAHVEGTHAGVDPRCVEPAADHSQAAALTVLAGPQRPTTRGLPGASRKPGNDHRTRAADAVPEDVGLA